MRDHSAWHKRAMYFCVIMAIVMLITQRWAFAIVFWLLSNLHAELTERKNNG